MEVQWPASAWWNAMNLLEKSNMTQIHIKTSTFPSQTCFGIDPAHSEWHSPHLECHAQIYHWCNFGAGLVSAGERILHPKFEGFGVIESFLSKQYLLHPFTRLRSKIFDVLVSVVQDPLSRATSWRKTPAGHMVV